MLGNYAGVWVGSAGIGFLGTSSSLPWERRGEVTSLGEEKERGRRGAGEEQERSRIRWQDSDHEGRRHAPRRYPCGYLAHASA